MFKPIDKTVGYYPNRYYEKIIERIREMMINGKLEIGGKIPSERELAEMFQVSRVPVREALKILEFMGVVQNIRGDGMYIKNIEISSLIDKIDFAIETSRDTIKELFEFRETIETTAAKFAALRRTNKDIELMKDTILEMETNISYGQDVYEAAYKFHNAVIKAAKNKILYSVYEFLNDLLKASKEITLSHIGRPQKSLASHKIILNKIIEQDEEGAMQCMLEHLKEAERSIQEDK